MFATNASSVKMANAGGSKISQEHDKECINLLYLASQKNINVDPRPRSSSMDALGGNLSDDMEINPSPTLAELAKTAPQVTEPIPSSGEPKISKARDMSPSPPAETRMSSRARLESQKSFAEERNRVPTIQCPKVNCPERIVR